jgi:preprotein translocase subunit SecY
MKSELPRRIVFTLGALLIFRLGSYIPLPGVAPNTWEQMFRSEAGGILGPLNMLAGGGIHRVGIFGLGILPYLSAAILIQLVSMVSSKLSGLSRDGEAGRRKIARYTVGLTIFLVGFQAFGIASSLQGIPNLVSAPGGLFVISTTATLTGGTIFLIWLSELITVHGIGNGLAWLVFAGLAARMPRDIATVIELTRREALTVERAWLLAILWVALIGLVVFVELARRRVPLEFAGRKLGDRFVLAQPAHLSLKINNAGLVPNFVNSWLLFLPLTLAGLVFGWTSPWMAAAYAQMAPGHLGHAILSSVAIVILAFIYTAFVVDPEHAAASLKKHGGVIPGVEPGEPTAEHLDHVVSYTTCIGAVYLAAVSLIPGLLLVYGEAPFYLDGTSVLVVVCTVLDIETQVRGQSLTEPGGVRG